MADAVIAAITVAAVALAATGLGAPIVRRWGAGLDAPEQWLLAPLTGAVPLAVAVLLIGSIDYSATSMTVGLGTAAALGAWALTRSRPPPPELPPLRGAAVPVAAALATVMLVAVLGAFAPPTDNDTLRYHLTLPRRDLELGRIVVMFGWSVYEFFPPLVSMLTHLAFAVGGASAAQLLGTAWLATAACSAALLARRLGGTPTVALTAALILASQRVMINLGPAVSVDTALAAYLGAALIVLPSGRHAALLGLLLGAALNVKYHAGLAVAAVLAAGLGLRLRQGRPILPLLGAGALAAAMIAPLLLRNALVTGNPVFPVFHHLLSADNADIFAAYAKAVGSREAVFGGGALLPLTIFLRQTEFDGFQFGFPIVLIALPWAFARRRAERIACLAVCGLYLAAWWLMMPHLLRFHQAVFAPMAALAALGLASAWDGARPFAWARAAFVGQCLVWAGMQSLFLGSTALHRLPAALGRVDAVSLLERDQFVHYSLISPCRRVEALLKPGERYLALVNDPSFHCPQAAAMVQVRPEEAAAFYSRRGLPPPDSTDLARRMEEENVRYLLVSHTYGTDDDPMVFGKHRYDAVVMPALRTLTPLGNWPSGMIYDGREMIAALRGTGGESLERRHEGH